MNKIIKQSYPLTIDFHSAEIIVNDIFKLVDSLKGSKSLSKKNYNRLNKITTKLIHPNPC